MRLEVPTWSGNLASVVQRGEVHHAVIAIQALYFVCCGVDCFVSRDPPATEGLSHFSNEEGIVGVVCV